MSLTDLIPVPKNVNQNVSAARQLTMKALLGNPRSFYSKDCLPVTNAKLKAMIKTASVGPFKVTGLNLAVDSLKQVMDDIKIEKPAIYQALGTVGMLCARLVRGSASSISNHSWGTAVDLTLEGILDERGNNKTQRGLAEIAPIFNRHEWYWGATFGTEDAMHFEISDQLIRKWFAKGVLASEAVTAPPQTLSLGDRGREVVALQKKLNEKGEKLKADGVFGLATHAAVIAFQAANKLTADGVVGKKTRAALGL